MQAVVAHFHSELRMPLVPTARLFPTSVTSPASRASAKLRLAAKATRLAMTVPLALRSLWVSTRSGDPLLHSLEITLSLTFLWTFLLTSWDSCRLNLHWSLDLFLDGLHRFIQ